LWFSCQAITALACLRRALAAALVADQAATRPWPAGCRQGVAAASCRSSCTAAG
jgi:hypothetical protein